MDPSNNTTTTNTNTNTNTITTTPFQYHALSSTPSSPTSPPPAPALPPSPPAVVLSPCAACKILRRRCVDRCVLAPYFPPTEPHKFTTAHRVFGASNIIKLLQELSEDQRADAVSSMVYEANARIRDPVYGCAGAICQLQKQVNELKTELARTQAELVNVRAQHANLVALICMEMAQVQPQCDLQVADGLEHEHDPCPIQTNSFYLGDSSQTSSVWDEPLWT